MTAQLGCGRLLEVSPRTILRDTEALSGAGVPVFATRGARGGFQLLGGYERSLPMARGRSARRAAGGRARARLSLAGRRLAALTGRPAGVQLRTRWSGAGTGSWVDATWPIDTLDAAVLDVLSLGPERDQGVEGDPGDVARRTTLEQHGLELRLTVVVEEHRGVNVDDGDEQLAGDVVAQRSSRST